MNIQKQICGENSLGMTIVDVDEINMYRTKEKLYLVGTNLNSDTYRILKFEIEHETFSVPVIVDDGVIYTKTEIDSVMHDIKTVNEKFGGVELIESQICAIVGFVKFTKGYYISIITKCRKIAVLGGHYIYHADEAKLVPLFTSTEKSPIEERNIATFQSVDLSRNFYFSYTYDLSSSLQTNLTAAECNACSKTHGKSVLGNFKTMFVWNYQMITNGRLKLGVGAGWIMPLIHGYAVQSKLGMIGKDIYITLIARRSRVFAGVRFLKRGINAKGYVANDVETEQIVHTMEFTSFDMPNSNPNSNPHYSSYVQHRGSIPLFWSQDTSAMKPKPPIELNISDPYFRTAGLHFQQLFKRYGTPIIALNLIKIRETTKRESMLGDEFFECIKYLNLGLPDNKKILYISWDMSRAKRNREDDVLAILEEIGEEAISLTGFFHNGPEPYINYLKRKDEAEFRTRRESAEYSRTPNVIMAYRKNRRLQNGVLRSNCIDCLDRTNAAQSIIGKVAFAHQLYELGALAEPYLPFDSDAAVILEEMYRDLGDTIALQYGGSHLVNTVETYRKVNNWSSSSRDFLVTLKRYYSNSFVDAERQEGINLFLEKTGKHLESQQTTPDQILDLDADDPFHCGELVLQDDSKTAKSDISRFDGVESIHVGGYEQKYPNVDIWSQCYNPHSYTSLASISPPRFSFNSHYSPASGDVNASPFSSKSGDEKRPSKRQNYIRGLIKAGPSTLVPEEFSSNYFFARRFGLDTNLDVVRLDYLKTKHPMGPTNIPEGRSADQSFYPDIPLASLTESKRHELVRDELLEIFSKNQRGLDPHLVTHGRACDDNSESSTISTDWTLFDIESVKNTASVSFDRSELFNDLPHVHIPTLSTFEALEYKEYVAQFESFAEKAYSHSQLFNIPRKDDQSASTGDGGLYTQLNTSLIQDICDIERDFTPFEPLNITKCT